MELLSQAKYKFIGPIWVNFGADTTGIITNPPSNGTTITFYDDKDQVLKQFIFNSSYGIFLDTSHDTSGHDSLQLHYENQVTKARYWCDDDGTTDWYTYKYFILSNNLTIDPNEDNHFINMSNIIYPIETLSGYGHDLGQNINSINNIKTGLIESLVYKIHGNQTVQYGNKIGLIKIDRNIPQDPIMYTGMDSKVLLTLEKDSSGNINFFVTVGDRTKYYVNEIPTGEIARYSIMQEYNKEANTNCEIRFNDGSVFIDSTGIHYVNGEIIITGIASNYTKIDLLVTNLEEVYKDLIADYNELREKLNKEFNSLRQTYVSR